MTLSDWLSIFFDLFFRWETYCTFKASRAVFSLFSLPNCLDNSRNRYWLFMEVDESINNDESQQWNIYRSLIDPEEPENSEDSKVGDKSTLKTFIHCRILLSEYLPLLLFVEWKKHFHTLFIVYLLGLSCCRGALLM